MSILNGLSPRLSFLKLILCVCVCARARVCVRVCVYIYLSIWEFMHVYAGALSCETGVSDPLELELEEVVSCLMWMLGTRLRFSSQTVCALSH